MRGSVQSAAGGDVDRGDLREPLSISPDAPLVDLSVLVQESGSDDRHFAVQVQTPHLDGYRDGRTGDWELPKSAAELVQEYMAQFSAAGQSPEARMWSLSGAGMDLFELAPALFKDALAKLIEAGRLRTILIASAERSIPWELMVPTAGSGAEIPGQDLPLGARFDMARWFAGGLAAPEPSAFADARVVAPVHGGLPPLKKAGKERDLVCRMFSGQAVSPALVGDIDKELKSWDGTLLHFVCHGDTPTPVSQVMLLDGTEKLFSTAVRAMPGLRAGLASGRALVFLNACKVGGAVPALGGSGGFAHRFIAEGARAVIAPLWNVDDAIAFEVARTFYERVVAEPRTPFAEIMREIRGRAYVAGGGVDTWAAYCYYGDPLLAAEA